MLKIKRWLSSSYGTHQFWYAISFVFALVLFACQKPSNNKKTTQKTTVHESADGYQKNEAKEKSAKFTPVMLGKLSSNDTLQVDLDNSQISWIGRKVTGEHSGSLHLSNGWVVMDKNVLIGGKFIFDMTSISNTDIESPEWKLKLEDHLKSEDFFNVDSFPHVILEIKEHQPLSDDQSTSNNQILADLTIRGIKQELSFPISLQQSGSIFLAEGTVDIDRTLYNIHYKSGKFIEDLGDKLIYDDFTVQFMVQTEGNKK